MVFRDRAVEISGHYTALYRPPYCMYVVSCDRYFWAILTQSDPVSRKRPFLAGLFFDWILLVLFLIVSRVDFIVFVLFGEAGGMREYTAVWQSKIGWRLCASRVLREQRVLRARRNLVLAGCWRWA